MRKRIKRFIPCFDYFQNHLKNFDFDFYKKSLFFKIETSIIFYIQKFFKNSLKIIFKKSNFF